MKKTGHPEGSPKQQTYSNDSNAQRQRILDALQQVGGEGLTTIQLREIYDVMAPAPRIFELRWEYGYNIQSIRDSDRNAQGHKHPCTRYVLFPGKWQGVAA